MKDRMFIKGFDKDLKCRGYQFEIGKEYKIDLPEGYTLTARDLCSDKVFHFCDSLEKVHAHYNCADAINRFCEIEVLGQFCETEDKCGSNHIKIIREITGAELQIMKGLTNGNTGLFNSGNRNSGDWNSGNWNSGNRNSGNWNSGDCNSGDWNSGNRNSGGCNSGDWNSGDCNSGDCNSGDCNSGNWNSGNWNSGNRNSGDCNSGNWNSGNWNSGNRNSGNWNSGDCNSGDCNSGDCNSGDWNSGNRNSGIFNKTNGSNGVFCNQEPTICIFNVQTNMTLSEFYKSKYWFAITSSYFPLTEWVEEPNNPTGGKLITHAYQEACRMWWDGMSDKNKAIIKDIPNFDIDVFCDITGIDRSEV